MRVVCGTRKISDNRFRPYRQTPDIHLQMSRPGMNMICPIPPFARPVASGCGETHTPLPAFQANPLYQAREISLGKD